MANTTNKSPLHIDFGNLRSMTPAALRKLAKEVDRELVVMVLLAAINDEMSRKDRKITVVPQIGQVIAGILNDIDELEKLRKISEENGDEKTINIIMKELVTDEDSGEVREVHKNLHTGNIIEYSQYN